MTKKTTKGKAKAKSKGSRRMYSGPAKKPKAKPGAVFILLDRSGSMADRWNESINAINAYVKKLQDTASGTDDQVTVAMFDQPGSGYGFFNVNNARIVTARDTRLSGWHPISPAEHLPDGMTPLYDAVGYIAARAEAAQYEKTVLIIVTDGHENASREINRERAKVLLDQCRGRGWQVIFMGADFDNFAQAAALGNAMAQTMSYNSAYAGQAHVNNARSTRSYLSGQNATMTFTADDRLAATGGVVNSNKPAA